MVYKAFAHRSDSSVDDKDHRRVIPVSFSLGTAAQSRKASERPQMCETSVHEEPGVVAKKGDLSRKSQERSAADTASGAIT